jgi:hypothetical protein
MNKKPISFWKNLFPKWIPFRDTFVHVISVILIGILVGYLIQHLAFTIKVNS